MNEAPLKLLREIYPVSRETIERLEIYVSRLIEWQARINLVAPSTLDEIWERHIADSLQCVAAKPEGRNWLDLGSGGGLPGLVLAAVMAEQCESMVTLVESIEKKAAFLRQTNRQMRANAVVLAKRIEALETASLQPDVVTARALASLPRLLELASPWLMNGSVGLFHKGRDFERELVDCDGVWTFDLVHHRSKTNPESVLLEISNLQRV
ncbi:MAG: 16S rRNA (guanine(527)-N(7))-methyltransferase RsmG [Pseudomonadota bacterium]